MRDHILTVPDVIDVANAARSANKHTRYLKNSWDSNMHIEDRVECLEDIVHILIERLSDQDRYDLIECLDALTGENDFVQFVPEKVPDSKP